MNDAKDKAEHLLTAEVNRSVEALKGLGKTVYEGRKPPAGAYAFFNHNSHAMTAVQDCGRILKRLFAGRALLTKLSLEEERVTPQD